jgi:hypothetical protein
MFDLNQKVATAGELYDLLIDVARVFNNGMPPDPTPEILRVEIDVNVRLVGGIISILRDANLPVTIPVTEPVGGELVTYPAAISGLLYMGRYDDFITAVQKIKAGEAGQV